MNIRFFDFRYCSTSWKKGTIETTHQEICIICAFQSDPQNTANYLIFAFKGPW